MLLKGMLEAEAPPHPRVPFLSHKGRGKFTTQAVAGFVASGHHQAKAAKNPPHLPVAARRAPSSPRGERKVRRCYAAAARFLRMRPRISLAASGMLVPGP